MASLSHLTTPARFLRNLNDGVKKNCTNLVYRLDVIFVGLNNYIIFSVKLLKNIMLIPYSCLSESRSRSATAGSCIIVWVLLHYILAHVQMLRYLITHSITSRPACDTAVNRPPSTSQAYNK